MTAYLPSLTHYQEVETTDYNIIAVTGGFGELSFCNTFKKCSQPFVKTNIASDQRSQVVEFTIVGTVGNKIAKDTENLIFALFLLKRLYQFIHLDNTCISGSSEKIIISNH